MNGLYELAGIPNPDRQGCHSEVAIKQV